MKVLVTGANSLLGVNVIVELLRRNYTVRGMVRTANKIPLTDTRLEEHVGKITSRNDVLEAARDCDVIVHIAANTSQHSQRYDEYTAVNLEGTKLVLEAAKIFQVKRTILVSTANVFGYGSLADPGTEEKDFCYPFTRSGYARSKYEAQVFALQFPREAMGDIIIVNPTFMIGRYDAKPGSGKIVIRGYKKRIVFVPPGGKNFIHVEDVAGAICNAMIYGKNRECYLLANENMSYKEFYHKLNEATCNKGVIVIIPKAFLLFIGILGSGLARCGMRTALHYNNMRILCIKNYYSNQKAVQEIQLRQTPVKAAISDAVSWFLESGMLKRS